MMSIEQQIESNMVLLESQHNVRILYACESGSRAWGFPSKDSDYDIRFIYAHEPNWYMSVVPKRDVIELPIEGVIDLGGWDIRKCLELLRKSNCALIEWLSSPIVYRENLAGSLPIKEMVPRAFLATSACHHYLAMAQRKTSEINEGTQVKLKTYFYALRATLCARYIEDHLLPPPMLLDTLIDEYIGDKQQKESLVALKNRKALGAEGEYVDRIDWLDEIVGAMQNSVEKNIPPNQEKQSLDVYDDVFRQILSNVWGN